MLSKLQYMLIHDLNADADNHLFRYFLFWSSFIYFILLVHDYSYPQAKLKTDMIVIELNIHSVVGVKLFIKQKLNI